MKTLNAAVVLFVSSVLVLHSQDEKAKADKLPGLAGTATRTRFSVAERGPHHRVWRRETFETGPGGIQRTNRHDYTELATGLHYRNTKGEWAEAKEKFELKPGRAVARQGQHKVELNYNLNSAGAIRMETSDGKVLKSQVLGLSYYDAASGKSVLIAEVKDCEGKVSGNQVIYEDAFTDFKADVRYTYSKAGFEQDIILREQPPKPEEYGLNPATAKLQVLTEFVEAPQPARRASLLRDNRGAEIGDEELDFGAMRMGRGKAFSLGREDQDVPVGKQWLKLEGREFLVEEVPVRDLRQALEQLPVIPGASVKPASILRRHAASTRRFLPEPKLASVVTNDMKLAQASSSSSSSGVVLDYIILNTGNQTDFTFQGDTTYYISGAVTLFGTVNFEGGTVIKYAPNASLSTVSGPVALNHVWPSAQYRPVIFTAVDDDTVGETIEGSTGNPSGSYYANPALGIYGASTTIGVTNAHFAYAKQGMGLASGAAVSHARFVNCQRGVAINDGNLSLKNALFANTETNFDIQCGIITVQNATFDGSQCLVNVAGSSITPVALTNCILANVSELYRGTPGPPGTFTGAYNGFFNSPTFGSSVFYTATSPFQPCGGGGYYLAGSVFRDVGTPAIDGALLADLKRKTTYPPVVYQSETFADEMSLSPQAQRDTDQPDLGYHYDPLDYVFGDCDAAENITFAPGTAVGWFFEWSGHGLHIADQKKVVFDGRVDNPAYWVRHNTVMECAHGEWPAMRGTGGITGSADQNLEDPGLSAELHLRFTRCSNINPTDNYFRDDWGYLTVRARDCEFYSGGFGGYVMTISMTNCLFDRTIAGSVEGHTGNEFRFHNCTWRGGWIYTYLGYRVIPVEFRDCAFDGTVFSLNGESDNNFGNNAYLDEVPASVWPGDPRLTPEGSGNVSVASFNWQKGPLGNFYLPNNSPLINADTGRRADQAGLYHYTTTTDQAKEGSSHLDMGYHYVALNPAFSTIVPMDTDDDGAPDYREDANGNGVYDPGSGETPWYPVDQLVFSPDGGVFRTRQNVTISCVTPGKTMIHYTLNGDDPTESDPTVLSGQKVVVIHTQTLKARAYLPGLEASKVKAASFKITGAIAAGQNHSLALKSDGTVWAAGANAYGQRGDGTTVTSNNLPSAPCLTDVVGIAGGQFFSLAWKSDGTVWGWGANGNGQLGNKHTGQLATPTRETNITGVIALAGGNGHTLAVKSDGTVWAWGLNDYFQLGKDGAIARSLEPIRVNGLTNITAVAAGAAHSLALDEDKTVWAWGLGTSGQLGDGSVLSRTNPMPVLKNDGTVLSGVSAIAAGQYHSLALTTDGKVWTWGKNDRGQLGHNDNNNRVRASQVAGLSGIVAIAAGGTNSLALKSDGTVWTWGDNTHGQLGNCTVGDSYPAPVQVGSLTDATVIAAGGDHCLALKSDGTIATWGWGNYGEEVANAYRCTPGIPDPTVHIFDWDDADSDSLITWRERQLGLNPDKAEDSDGDGMPDGWEITYGLNPQSNDASDDPDNDGLNNLYEYRTGTHPRAWTDVRLGHWSFNGSLAGDEGQVPRTGNMATVPEGICGALEADGSGPTYLNYNDAEVNGRANINCSKGTIRFWYMPHWSTSSGGPGGEASLVNVGSNWKLTIGPQGKKIFFTTPDGVRSQANYVTMNANQWYQICLTYGPEGTVLYTNGVKTYMGTHLGVVNYPDKDARLAAGMNVGCNGSGGNLAKGLIDELETFNKVLSETEVAAGYQIDTDYDGLTDATELNDDEANTDPCTPNPADKKRLAYWRFNNTLDGEKCQNLNRARVPLPVGEIGFHYYEPNWNGQAVCFSEGGGWGLRYNEIDDGYPNINCRNGTVRFWFKPHWTSKSAGGAGTDKYGRFFELGSWGIGESFTMDYDPNLEAIRFYSESNRVIMTYFAAPCALISNRWYQMTLAYSPSNVAFYINGLLATTCHAPSRASKEAWFDNAAGYGIDNYPPANVRSYGLTISHGSYGDGGIKGEFDEFETYNYPLTPQEVAGGFPNYNEATEVMRDSDYDGRSDLLETYTDGTLANDSDSVVPTRLGYWRFNDSLNIGEMLQMPLLATSVDNPDSWSTKSLRVSSAADSRVVYRDVETNGWANFNCRKGAVRFWFKPDWCSGNGPASRAPFISMGTDSNWWAFYVGPAGSSLGFALDTPAVSSQLFNVPFSFNSNSWYQVAFNYSPTNLTLYVNGTNLINQNIPNWSGPCPDARTNGLTIGNWPRNTAPGNSSINGQFEELETFNYNLLEGDIKLSFDTVHRTDSDLNGVADLREELSLPESAPFMGVPFPVTGVFEAEQFDHGGRGIAYSNSPGLGTTDYRATGMSITNCNDMGAGYCVDQLQAGDWMKYTIDVRVGQTYAVESRLAGLGTNGAFRIEFYTNNILAGWTTNDLVVPATEWTNATFKNLWLPAGTNVMKVILLTNGMVNGASSGQVMKLNYISIYPSWNEGVTNIDHTNTVTGLIADACDYTTARNNALAIQSAINERARILLPEGRFYVAALYPNETHAEWDNTAVFVSSNNVHVEGMGKTKTTLVGHNRATTFFFIGRKNTNADCAVTNITLANLTLEGSPHWAYDITAPDRRIWEEGTLVPVNNSGSMVIIGGKWDTNKQPFYGDPSVNILVTNCLFKNSPCDAIASEGVVVKNLLVTKCDFIFRADGTNGGFSGRISRPSVTTATHPIYVTSGGCGLWLRDMGAMNVVVTDCFYDGHQNPTNSDDSISGVGLLWYQLGGNWFAARNTIKDYCLEAIQWNCGPGAIVQTAYASTNYDNGSTCALENAMYQGREGASPTRKIADLSFSFVGNEVVGGRQGVFGAAFYCAKQMALYALLVSGNTFNLSPPKQTVYDWGGSPATLWMAGHVNLSGNTLWGGAAGMIMESVCTNVLVLKNDFGAASKWGVEQNYGAQGLFNAQLIRNTLGCGVGFHVTTPPADGTHYFLIENDCRTPDGGPGNLFTDPQALPVHRQ